MNDFRDYYASNDDIYDTLRREILNLDLPPGHPLPENEIAKRFHVSRTPVRSVFERLKSDNFIEVLPRRGTFVTLLDMDAIEQIIYLRIRVESGILVSLAQNPDKLLLDKLSANLLQQKRLLLTDVDAEEFYRSDSKFHEICFKASGKGKLWEIIQQFFVHYTRYRMLDFTATSCYEQVLADHSLIFEYIKTRRADLIESYISQHLRGGLARMEERLKTEFRGYFSNSRESHEELSEINRNISSAV